MPEKGTFYDPTMYLGKEFSDENENKSDSMVNIGIPATIEQLEEECEYYLNLKNSD